MEIRIQRRLTGRQWQAAALERHGGRRGLEVAARDDPDAADALWMLERFEEEPTRLEETFEEETVWVLDPEDLQRLTPARLLLLDVIARNPDCSLATLVQEVARDKKNVSDDIRFLESIGLVASKPDGRRKRMRLAGHEIRIIVGS